MRWRVPCSLGKGQETRVAEYEGLGRGSPNSLEGLDKCKGICVLIVGSALRARKAANCGKKGDTLVLLP